MSTEADQLRISTLTIDVNGANHENAMAQLFTLVKDIALICGSDETELTGVLASHSD